MQRRMVNKEDSEMAVFSKCRDLITHTTDDKQYEAFSEKYAFYPRKSYAG